MNKIVINKEQAPGFALVLYENLAAREQAVRFCEQLTAHSADEPQPSVKWCSFESLRKAGNSNKAATVAAQAELIIFAITFTGDLPEEIKVWTESWLSKRGEREGALVGLVLGHPSKPWEAAGLKEIYLRHLAHRAGMDYLSQVPGKFLETMPDSLESFSQRAGQVTPVMDEILNTRFAPPSMPL